MTRSAVIFDFDGTLTVPYLDFEAIKAEIGVEAGPILEAMERMTPAEQDRAAAILNRYEEEAAHAAELHDGAVETIAELRRRGHPVGVLTRNVRHWVQVVMERFGLQVDALRTREDGAIKPAPDGVLALCQQLEAAPARSWMVGDYLFDILAGRAAGTQTVLMIGDREPPDFAGEADHVIRTLPEMLALVDMPPRRDERCA